jgi:hypothetical protein
VEGYLAAHAERIGRIRELQRRASAASPSALSVIVSELRALLPDPGETQR